MDIADSLRQIVREVVREELARHQIGASVVGDQAQNLAAVDVEFLSTAAAAALAKIAPDTLRRWASEGRIRTARAGRELRFARADIVSLLTTPRGSARAPALAGTDARTPEQRGLDLYAKMRGGKKPARAA